MSGDHQTPHATLLRSNDRFSTVSVTPHTYGALCDRCLRPYLTTDETAVARSLCSGCHLGGMTPEQRGRALARWVA